MNQVILSSTAVFLYLAYFWWYVDTHEGTSIVRATSSEDQVPSCELPIFVKKCSCKDQNLVSAISPAHEFKWSEFVVEYLLNNTSVLDVVMCPKADD